MATQTQEKFAGGSASGSYGDVPESGSSLAEPVVQGEVDDPIPPAATASKSSSARQRGRRGVGIQSAVGTRPHDDSGGSISSGYVSMRASSSMATYEEESLPATRSMETQDDEEDYDVQWLSRTTGDMAIAAREKTSKSESLTKNPLPPVPRDIRLRLNISEDAIGPVPGIVESFQSTSGIGRVRRTDTDTLVQIETANILSSIETPTLSPNDEVAVWVRGAVPNQIAVCVTSASYGEILTQDTKAKQQKQNEANNASTQRKKGGHNVDLVTKWADIPNSKRSGSRPPRTVGQNGATFPRHQEYVSKPVNLQRRMPEDTASMITFRQTHRQQVTNEDGTTMVSNNNNHGQQRQRHRRKGHRRRSTPRPSSSSSGSSNSRRSPNHGDPALRHGKHQKARPLMLPANMPANFQQPTIIETASMQPPQPAPCPQGTLLPGMLNYNNGMAPVTTLNPSQLQYSSVVGANIPVTQPQVQYAIPAPTEVTYQYIDPSYQYQQMPFLSVVPSTTQLQPTYQMIDQSAATGQVQAYQAMYQSAMPQYMPAMTYSVMPTMPASQQAATQCQANQYVQSLYQQPTPMVYSPVANNQTVFPVQLSSVPMNMLGSTTQSQQSQQLTVQQQQQQQQAQPGQISEVIMINSVDSSAIPIPPAATQIGPSVGSSLATGTDMAAAAPPTVVAQQSTECSDAMATQSWPVQPPVGGAMVYSV